MRDTTMTNALTAFGRELDELSLSFYAKANRPGGRLDIAPELERAARLGQIAAAFVIDRPLQDQMAICRKSAVRALDMAGDDDARFGRDAFRICEALRCAQDRIGELVAV